MAATRKEKISLYFHHPIDEYIKPRYWKNIVPLLTYEERFLEAKCTLTAYAIYLFIPFVLLSYFLGKIPINKDTAVCITVLLTIELLRRLNYLRIKGRSSYRPFLGLWNFYLPTTVSILSITILLTSTASLIQRISTLIVLVNIAIFAVYVVRATTITEKQELVKSTGRFILLFLSLLIPVAMLFFMTYVLLQQIDALTTLQEILLSSITPSIFLGWFYQNRKTSIEHYLPTHKKLFASIPKLIEEVDLENIATIEHFISTIDTDMRATAPPKLIDQWEFFVAVLKLSNTKENIHLKKYATAHFLDASRIFVGLNGFLHFPWQTWHYKPLTKLYTYCGLPPNPPKEITKRYWAEEITYANNPLSQSVPLIINTHNEVLSQKKGILKSYKHTLFEGPRLALSNHPLITTKTTIKKIDNVLPETNLPATNVTYYTVIYDENALSKENLKGHTWKQLDKTNLPAELLTSFLSLKNLPKKAKRNEAKKKSSTSYGLKKNKSVVIHNWHAYLFVAPPQGIATQLRLPLSKHL